MLCKQEERAGAGIDAGQHNRNATYQACNG